MLTGFLKLSALFFSFSVSANPTIVPNTTVPAHHPCAAIIAISPESIRRAILEGGTILAQDKARDQLHFAQIYLLGWMDTFPDEIPLDLLDYLTRFRPARDWPNVDRVHAKARRLLADRGFLHPETILPEFHRALAAYQSGLPNYLSTARLGNSHGDLRHLLFTNPEIIPPETLVYLSTLDPICLVPWPDLEMVHARALELMASPEN